jgi:hypothetical protein
VNNLNGWKRQVFWESIYLSSNSKWIRINHFESITAYNL